jgi:hypothetical protein
LNIPFSYHIELPPDGGPLSECGGDFLYEWEVTGDDSFMLPGKKARESCWFHGFCNHCLLHVINSPPRPSSPTVK